MFISFKATLGIEKLQFWCHAKDNTIPDAGRWGIVENVELCLNEYIKSFKINVFLYKKRILQTIMRNKKNIRHFIRFKIKQNKRSSDKKIKK